MKKKSTEVVELLERYFDAMVIGSHLFVRAKLLSIDDTNDIDLFVKSGEQTAKMETFLKDQGFIGTVVEVQPDIYSEKVTVRTKYAHPDYDKIIDVNYLPSLGSREPYEISQLVKAKFESGRPEDLKQLSMVIFNSAGKSLSSIKSLQEFYISNQDKS